MDFKYAHDRMVQEQIISRGIQDPAVIAAFRVIPRHIFVDPALQAQSYSDNALPIGEGQTISQPYMVALMTSLLKLKRGDKVLEIGTGSGYQASILHYFTQRVYTIERNEKLAKRAQQLFKKLGYQNIVTKIGDGSMGWPAMSPFDAIVVTAGGPSIPEILKQQLSENGKLVMPVGSQEKQKLIILHKNNNSFIQEEHGSCVFVPLIGARGWVNKK